MTDRVKNIALIAASITALALGGSAIADAASGGGSDNSSSNDSARAAQRHAGLPPQRADETLLTGDTAAQVRKAALAKVSGATIERIETDDPPQPRARSPRLSVLHRRSEGGLGPPSESMSFIRGRRPG